MGKYKRSKQELQEHWDDQIRFIQKSIEELGSELGIRKAGNLQFFCCRQILLLLYQFIFIE